MKKQPVSKNRVQDDPSVIEAMAVLEQCSSELQSVTSKLDALINRQEPITDPLTKARNAITSVGRDEEITRLLRRKASLEEAVAGAEAEVQRRTKAVSAALKASYRPQQNALRFATIEAAEALLAAIRAEDDVLDELLSVGADVSVGGMTLGHVHDMTAIGLAELIQRLRDAAELERCQLTPDDGSLKRVRLLRDTELAGHPLTLGSVVDLPAKEATRMVLTRGAEWAKGALFKATRQSRAAEPACLE